MRDGLNGLALTRDELQKAPGSTGMEERM